MGNFSQLKRIFLYSLIVATILAVSGVAYYYVTLYTGGPAQEGYLALQVQPC
jgi:hypothetical protein